MYFGEINHEIRVWFARRVRQGLEAMRVYEGNSWETRHYLSDPELLEWAVEWYCKHIAEFIKGTAPDTFCVDDIHNDERVEYQRKAVCCRCWEVLDMANAALGGAKEAKQHDTLDAWLEALNAGDLEWSGPTEDRGGSLVVA